jgi:hypothetical protein
MRSGALAWSILAGCLAFGSRVLAQGPSVELVRPPASSCVSGPQLAEELERSGVAVSLVDEPSTQAVTGIRVAGPPDALEVALRKDGVERAERMAPARCETATDVVTAFVVSALGRAPDDIVDPLPEAALRAPIATTRIGERASDPSSAGRSPRPRPTIYLRAGGEIAMLWLARYYNGVVYDPARVRAGAVHSGGTRLGRAEIARAVAGLSIGRAALGLEFEHAWAHLRPRPGLLAEAGTSLEPGVIRRAWSLTGEGRTEHLVVGAGLGLVTTVERTAPGLRVCCGANGEVGRTLVRSTYLLAFSGGYRYPLISDALFIELRGRASVAGFNPFPFFRLALPGWFGPVRVYDWIDGTSLGMELGLSFN